MKRRTFSRLTMAQTEIPRELPSGSALVVFVLFLVMGLTALACGGLLIIDGLGMPESVLEHSPFSSFFWPGITLAVMIGGGQLFAARMLWFHRDRAAEIAILAAILLLGWIGGEAIMVRDGRILQLVIAIHALLELGLVLRLLRHDEGTS